MQYFAFSMVPTFHGIQPNGKSQIEWESQTFLPTWKTWSLSISGIWASKKKFQAKIDGT